MKMFWRYAVAILYTVFCLFMSYITGKYNLPAFGFIFSLMVIGVVAYTVKIIYEDEY